MSPRQKSTTTPSIMEMEEKQIHTIIVNKVSIIYLHKKKNTRPIHSSLECSLITHWRLITIITCTYWFNPIAVQTAEYFSHILTIDRHQFISEHKNITWFIRKDACRTVVVHSRLQSSSSSVYNLSETWECYTLVGGLYRHCRSGQFSLVGLASNVEQL